ncbi:MAG: valine--tRNA ligase [Candidatus Levybacteria bacterium]|nr:valine--tRNA ligase [Candidatus Levybacteria bacterium]
MDKVYNHKDVEEKIYKSWEERGYFRPEINPQGKPYCIILPPPNANGDLHFGHAMFTIEDILIRYHRMKGDAVLWLPGTDHAGIETQFVFDKKLQAEGKSRLNYDQETLYQMIWEYVEQNRGKIENQLRRLGFSLDWTREKYTLDPDIVKLVYQTFKRMYDEGLVYRDYRLVNYCTRDGTSFSDLEVVHEERQSPLYYIKYGPLVLATTRPETKFGDTGVAVNPSDERYRQYVGKEIEIETVLGKAKIKVVADEAVDPKFGTGVVKVTPAHDFTDFEIGKRHNLQMKQVIGFDGMLNEQSGKFVGLYVKKAREAVVEEMKKKGLIEKIDENYIHRIGLCYKCKTVIEPLPKEQWFVKVETLKQQAIDVVRAGKVKIFPKTFETQYFQWLENLRDWNISRQIVWGIRIPAWQCKACKVKGQKSKVKTTTQNSKVFNNLTIKQFNNSNWIITDGEKPDKCPNCNSNDLEQDTDTFDTWFSSGQWPFVTLRASHVKTDFDRFYPTSVMETAYDILRAWVSRMVMFGLYATGKTPFKNVLFHGIVNDPYGKKMSKSKGNVVNPLELIDQYGADAVRFALIYGNATGNDQSLSYSKLDAARKFTNKLWNIARFIYMKREIRNPKSEIRNNLTIQQFNNKATHENDKKWIQKTEELVVEITQYVDKYQFNLAAERLYEFIWHEFADKYIEDVKNRIDDNSFLILNSLFLIQLKLLHPFMPFVTEAIYQRFTGEKQSIMIESWPSV